MAKTPKGELTSAEIRTLIRGHNKMTNIKVPKGLDRDGLIKWLKGRNFEVDHKNKKLVDKAPSRGKVATLETSKAITKPKSKTQPKKTKDQKDKEMREKVIKFIMDNKDILDDERLK